MLRLLNPPILFFSEEPGTRFTSTVTGNAPLPLGYGGGDGRDTSPPGFRCDDLPSDEAVALPQVMTPPVPPTSPPYPGGLLSYPFFAYHRARRPSLSSIVVFCIDYRCRRSPDALWLRTRTQMVPARLRSAHRR